MVRMKKIFFLNLVFLMFSTIIYSNEEEKSLEISSGNLESGKQLYLFYKIETDKNLLILKWNNEGNENDRYYIFGKEKKGEWILLNEEGVIGNQYELKLKESNNKSFVVCGNTELPQMDKNIIISSTYNDDLVGMFRELKGTESIESNKVYIAFDSSKINEIKNENILEAELKKKVVKKDDIEKTKKESNEIFYVLDEKVITEEEKININKEKEKEANKVVNITNEIAKINEGSIKDIKGLFKIENNKETKINYMGLTLNIPEKAAPENSYIYIMPLMDENILKVNNYTENITCSDVGSIRGYNIALLRKEDVKDKTGDKNIFSIEGLNKPIDISMKFSNGSENDVILMFYYSTAYNRWENVVRIKEIDIKDKSITACSKELGQFYVGLFK